MQHFSRTAVYTNAAGNLVPDTNVTVTVTDYLTGATASLYEANESTGKTNPIVVPPGDNGFFEFKIEPGAYNIAIVGDNSSRTLQNVVLSDPHDNTIDVTRMGAVGDGSTDCSPAIQAAIDKLDPNVGGVIKFPRGSYMMKSGVSTLNRQGIRFVGEGKGSYAGFGGKSVELITDQAIDMFTFGDGSITYWSGPSFENLTFRDSSASGQATSAIKLMRWNNVKFTDCGFTDFRVGACLYFDGTGDASQYHTIIHCWFTASKYGIRVKGTAPDVTIIGGQFSGWDSVAGAKVSGCKGIWHENPGVGVSIGRWKIYGTTFNDWDYGIDADSARIWDISGAAFETRISITGTGVGLKIGGVSGGTDEGTRNVVRATVFVRLATGIEYGADSISNRGRDIFFNSCTTRVNDSGISNLVEEHQIGAPRTEQRVGYSFTNPAGTVTHEAGICHVAEVNPSAHVPCLYHEDGRGWCIREDRDNDGGGYIGANNGAGIGHLVLGAGIIGDPAQPRVGQSLTKYAGLQFINDEMQFFSETGKTAGDAVPPALGTNIHAVLDSTDGLILRTDTIEGLKFHDGLSLGDAINFYKKESNWTPVLSATSTPGTHTYTTQVGRYVIHQEMVFAWFDISISALDNTLSGTLEITGLPETIKADSSRPAYGIIGTVEHISLLDYILVRGTNNTTKFSLLGCNTDAVETSLSETHTKAGSSGAFVLRGLLIYHKD